jgi:hypothetical protein
MAAPDGILKRDLRTLEAIFRHPVTRNLAWSDARHLIESLGAVRQEHNGHLLMTVGTQREMFHQPHDNELTAEEVARLRKFLESAGVTPDSPEVAQSATVPSAANDMLVAVDHHQARVFTIERAAAGAKTLRPYDPHHFLHHMRHRQEDRLRGEREPEEASYYEAVAAALAGAQRIVILGHASGHSNAAARLEEVLRAKYPETFSRVRAVRAVDLSAVTEPQLLALALETLKA